jgi:hypothetical protein
MKLLALFKAQTEAPMKHRKLRIAWSVAWGIAAVLLIVLWARTYQHVDMLSVSAET